MHPYLYSAAVLVFSPALLAQDVAILDFDYAHGTVINNQYAVQGITISVSGGQNIAIVYDSELGGINGDSIDGADTDLERLSPTENPLDWDGGNLGADYNAGGLLIIQENPAVSSPPTYGSGASQVTSASNYDPDDNAGGGTITFDIDHNTFSYHYFNAILADFEEDGSYYSSTLYGINNTVETFSFADFTDPTHPSYNPSVTSGDNHINRLPEISLSSGEALTRVDIAFDNSSGSVSSIIFSKYPVPEPSSVTLLALSTLIPLLRRKHSPTFCPYDLNSSVLSSAPVVNKST